MDKKKNKLRKLLHLYLFILILTLILVVPAHLFPPPSFMPFRFPHYLEKMGPFLGIAWPMSFEIYHYALYILVIIGSLNTLTIIFYPKLRKTAIASCLIGLFLIPLMVLFFFLQFIKVNKSTAVIFGVYSMILLVVDWKTFKALIKERKEALRG